MTSSELRTRRPTAGGPDGVVLLDKPLGLTSNQALQRVKRLFEARKAGHTGSLDPLASGLLPICLGQATRFSGYLLDAPKAYRVSGRLGSRTATGDAEGEIVERCAWDHVGRDGFEAALLRFKGRSRQVPPMYSALKQGGEALYRKARRGETVERAPREIEISALELVSWEPPEFGLDLHCSKGTYVRSLVEDIAAAVDSCAHVTALRRYAAGPYGEREMHSLDTLKELAVQGPQALATALLATDSALDGLPELQLDEEEARRLAQGKTIATEAGAGAGLVRLYVAGRFLGVGARDVEGKLRVRRLLDTSGDV
jgi:tRNA pseudouridine55 synthase